MHTRPFANSESAMSFTHHLAYEMSGNSETWKVDPHGSVPLYRLTGTDRVSVSPIELMGEAGLEPEPAACASYLHSGVFYGGVLHPRIEALPPDSRVRREGGELSIEAPSVDALWREPAPASAEKLVSALQEAVLPLRGQRVVCDLTGGLDSRLVALSLVSAGIPFDAVVTGPENSPDVLLAARIARHLGVRLTHETRQAPDDLNTWRQALEQAGGVVRPRLAARLLALQTGRSDYDVSVGGLGGELLRDFWWLQDPLGLEDETAPDWGRLIRTRIFQSPQPRELLRGEWADAVAEGTKQCVDFFGAGTRNLELKRKRDLLDFAYLRLHLAPWAGANLSLSSSVIQLHNPILHPGVLQVAWGATLKQRRLGTLVRESISLLDRKAAAIPVESGGTALPLGPMTPWRRLPLFARLFRSAARRLPFRRRGSAEAWAALPLPLTHLEQRGIVDPDAVRRYAGEPGSLTRLERLVGLELVFAVLS